jgi:hypothetical protein
MDGISLAQVAKDLAEVEIEWPGVGSAKVWYLPSKFTPELEQQMLEAAKAGEDYAHSEGTKPMVEVVCDLVADWDLYSDEANTVKVPLKFDAVNKLPMAWLVAVFDGIAEHMRGKVQGSKTPALPR